MAARSSDTVTVVLPALDEEAAIAAVVRGARAHADEVIVVDGGSRDATAERARAHGAHVVVERRRGFGRACASGLEAARGAIVVFMDADGSFDPDDIPRVVGPVATDALDLCLGSRRRSPAQPWHLRVANRVVGQGCRLAVGRPLSDLGPLRAIRTDTLRALGMTEMTVGWPLEMVLRAGRRGLRIGEVDVAYGPRLGGVSKVTGSLRGTLRVSRVMGAMILRDAATGGRR